MFSPPKFVWGSTHELAFNTSDHTAILLADAGGDAVCQLVQAWPLKLNGSIVQGDWQSVYLRVQFISGERLMHSTELPQGSPPGKRVASNSYFHRDAVPELDPVMRAQVWAAEAFSGGTTWNVAKLREGRREYVSLLTYEDFERSFPALLESVTVHLDSGVVVRRSYRDRLNPPVLHRKELLLPAGHPRLEDFARLTVQLESFGVFQDASNIGTRLAWERRLREAGVKVIGHEVQRCDASISLPPITIHRHLAAIRRDGLSSPIQSLLRHGIIQTETTVLDYGCGRGSDVEGLRKAGIIASGWDPYVNRRAILTP